MNESANRRTDSVRIKLAPEMLVRLEKMAALYGMPTATLTAFAVAEWLSTKENAFVLSQVAVRDLADKVGGDLGSLLSKAVDSKDMQQAVLKLSSLKG